MTELNISRQHDQTCMVEIVGEVSDNFTVVYGNSSGLYQLFYLKLAGVFHRFHCDAGILFWQSGENPDEDDDLGEDDIYIDFSKKYDLNGSLVEEISFANNHLRMVFSNKVNLLFECGVDDIGARMIK